MKQIDVNRIGRRWRKWIGCWPILARFSGEFATKEARFY